MTPEELRLLAEYSDLWLAGEPKHPHYAIVDKARAEADRMEADKDALGEALDDHLYDEPRHYGLTPPWLWDDKE